jgi:ADP-dependent NAD(P)H-hydrate dehydratase / NAD(P)H-hydrate epimerase
VKVVSASVMAAIDRRAQAEFSFPSLLLMEDAGLEAWARLRRLVRAGASHDDAGGRIVFVAGRGNNGGDALVMARRSAVEAVGTPVIVLAGGRPDHGSDPGRMLSLCASLGIPCVEWPAQADEVRDMISPASWIVDGIAGTGLRGALRPALADLVTLMNASPARRVAVDVPSGLHDEYRAGQPVVRADVTLTMGLPKTCLYLPAARVSCGKIMVVPVGFPPALLDEREGHPGEILSPSAWRGLLPPVAPDTHKNERGHLAVFAGSPGTTGAAWLASSAAARCRVGLVTLFTPAAAWPVLAARLASVMCRPFDPGDAASWEPHRFNAVLVGPGWGTGEANARWLAHLLSQGLPGVIDADGLTLLARSARTEDLGGSWVLTPHPGEFARLAGMPKESVLENPVEHAGAYARRVNAVVVLKGHCTVIAVPDGRFWILDGANPALATGGAGDVLAGVIAAGLAAGMDTVSAALFGVSLHSQAGRAAVRGHGWFLAEDLVPLLSRLLS